jgi:hypothetical protein
MWYGMIPGMHGYGMIPGMHGHGMIPGMHGYGMISGMHGYGGYPPEVLFLYPILYIGHSMEKTQNDYWLLLFKVVSHQC